MSEIDLWEASAPAWIALMEKGDLTRTVLLDPVMLRLAGNVQGVKVCDVGCGEGRFCRMLAERGASTTGVEPTPGLIEAARQLHPDGQYIEAGGESLPFSEESFDLVVSYLVLIDILDFRTAIREMARIIRPGGRLLIASMNSFATTREYPWVKDEEGHPLYMAVDRYFDEEATELSWSGIRIVNYHRPFEAYMQALLAVGLRLTDFEEPTVSAEEAERFPRMAIARRVPAFHVMQWRKD